MSHGIEFGSWQLGNSESWSKMSEAEGFKLVKEALFEGVIFLILLLIMAME